MARLNTRIAPGSGRAEYTPVFGLRPGGVSQYRTSDEKRSDGR